MITGSFARPLGRPPFADRQTGPVENDQA